MKYFKEKMNAYYPPEEGLQQIILEVEKPDLDERIFSITKTKKGIYIREECDQYFGHAYTTVEAVELLEEAIEWIKNKM